MEWMARLMDNGSPSLEAQALYRQAFEMFNTGKPGAALSVLEKVIMIAPQFTKALFMMGNCLDSLGRYKEAVNAYNKVLAIEPSYEGATLKLDLISKKINSSPTGRQNFSGEKGEALIKITRL